MLFGSLFFFSPSFSDSFSSNDNLFLSMENAAFWLNKMWCLI